MADVIGAAEFELRATRDKLKGDIADAEQDLRKSTQQIERDYSRLTAAQVREMGGLEGVAKRLAEQHRATGKAAADSAQLAEREFRKSSDGISRGIRQMAGALAAAFSVREITRMADSWTDLNSRVRLAVDEHENAEAVMDRLTAMARRTYTAIDITAEGFLQNSNALRELGYSTDQTLDFIESLNNAMVVSGAKGQRAETVMNALSRAMAGGKLQGNDLNTIMQTGGRVTEALAASLGVTTGELRKLSHEGKLTTKVLFEGMTSQLEKLRAEADSMPATVADAFVILGNTLKEYVGKTDESLSGTERMSKAIIALAENLDDIIPLLAALTVGIGVNYVGGMVAAHRATLSLTGAMAGLRTAMTFIATHPILIALTALAAGVTYLALKADGASGVMADLNRTTSGAKTALEAYEKAAADAANATKENAAEARANAEAMREEAIAAVNSARALRERTRAAAAAAVRESEERASNADGGRGERALFGQRAREARVRATRAGIEAFMSEGELAEIERKIASGGYKRTAGGGASDDDDGKKAKRLAMLREDLALERAIAEARATGDEAAIKAAEERQRLVQLIRQYEAAGYADALSQATSHLALLNEAEKLAEDREKAEQRSAKIKEIAERTAEREARLAKRLNEQLLDRLGYEAEIARLRGDPRAIETAERALFIEERINDLLRLRPGLTAEAARRQAENEFDELGSADRVGRMREEFRYAFRDGIKAAIDGDVGSFFESLADRFTDRMLDNLADDLFDLLSQAAKGMSSQGGGGWFSAIGNFLGSTFGGGRASGGPMMGGNWYRVGEHGPENIVMPRDGFAIPADALEGGGGGATSQRPTLVKLFLDEGGLFKPRVEGIAGPIAVETGSAAYSGARETVPAEMAMKSRYTRGRGR